MQTLTQEDLLKRIHLSMPLADIVAQIVTDFHLNTLVAFEPLLVGFEEVNILLTTHTKQYIIKIFSKHKSLETIQANVTALVAFHTHGIPTPRLYTYQDHEYLYSVPNNPHCYCIVMDYFDGHTFTDVPPTAHDIHMLTQYLAHIHTLKFSPHTSYDMWLTINLVKEYADKKSFLSPTDDAYIEPVIKKTQNVQREKLTKSIVHFDLHRENALKDDKGNYCILDLASCDYNYTVIDIGTFIALFCFDETLSDQQIEERYSDIVATYKKHRPLSPYEETVLPCMIQATYAANLLIASYLQKTENLENPESTAYYLHLGQNGLKKLSSIPLFNQSI